MVLLGDAVCRSVWPLVAAQGLRVPELGMGCDYRDDCPVRPSQGYYQQNRLAFDCMIRLWVFFSTIVSAPFLHIFYTYGNDTALPTAQDCSSTRSHVVGGKRMRVRIAFIDCTANTILLGEMAA